MSIEVGSRAAMKRVEGFKRTREPDFDMWFATQDEADHFKSQGKGYDASAMPEHVLNAFQDASKRDGVATLDDLMTIKLSHLPYDINWHKHQADYLYFKKSGAKVNKDLYDIMKVHWRELFGNKPFLSLYRTKDQFFDDYVSKPYDHDWLHELVAYPNAPVYSLCLKDGEQVAIDKQKFLSLPFDQQIKMFREETTVIAIERWMVNPACKGQIRYPTAYARAVHKTITALTKGWASEFMCENLELLQRPTRDDVKHAFETLKIEI